MEDDFREEMLNLKEDIEQLEDERDRLIPAESPHDITEEALFFILLLSQPDQHFRASGDVWHIPLRGSAVDFTPHSISHLLAKVQQNPGSCQNKISTPCDSEC